MTNDEALMTKEIQNPNDQGDRLRHWIFVIELVIRASSLVIGRGSSCSGSDMRTAEF